MYGASTKRKGGRDGVKGRLGGDVGCEVGERGEGGKRHYVLWSNGHGPLDSQCMLLSVICVVHTLYWDTHNVST